MGNSIPDISEFLKPKETRGRKAELQSILNIPICVVEAHVRRSNYENCGNGMMAHVFFKMDGSDEERFFNTGSVVIIDQLSNVAKMTGVQFSPDGTFVVAQAFRCVVRRTGKFYKMYTCDEEPAK